MSKFIFIYHGGTMPQDPAETAQIMEAWGNWFQSMGDAVIDGGAPVGQSKTVSSSGVTDDGGSNPISGYSLIEAENIASAAEMAKGCPILEHGTVEIAETMKM